MNSLLLAVRPQLPANPCRRLRDCVLGWSGTDSGRSMLAKLAWPGVVVAHDDDYAEVRELASRLRKYLGG